ncbi:cytochrome oxidase c subunit VIb-domain-containing protein [Exophiala viscosa]|uniref:Cytochrome oxidase c subunit VIb-domain-containing protein n=1 Tax=Exophiala viscosa TaxID=2486360 RepID=A0AAN6DUB7_9EURO|nr:cytochrome oxidase c subunit VIb-domain-containing protein [Exophiala viscosa]KAI1619860.1 cytochrome oxidase c subunit VIb-domain-containing protein [Exophiala viscosa]
MVGLPTWLGGTATPSQPESARPKSKDGGFVAPDRSSREVCYESRDLFFECLDKNNILDAIKEDGKARKVCSEEVTAYERDCARSWIKYFKEKRVMEYNRDQTLARIQQDDAKMAAKSKSERGKGSWFG